MANKSSHAADLAGLSRLTVSAVHGVTELAEEVHLKIINQAPESVAKPLGKATSFVYKAVRGVTQLVGGGLAGTLAKLQPLLGEQKSWAGREALLAALNGVLGDYLAASANPLAITMRFRRDGQPYLPQAPVSGRILVLVHGLCMNDLQWRRNGHDHGAQLALERGYATVYLHYNSGQHISENGRAFAQQLETLLAQWPVPVEELVLLGHSMGGLLSRSACHYAAEAGHSWLKHLSKMVFLGSPHHGAPLERGGNWFHVITELTPYTAPFSRLGKLRSAGITDLRHGSVLDQDWQGKDRFAHGHPLPAALPLPPQVACYTVAATISKHEAGLAARIAGDGLVPLPSALGQHEQPARDLHFAADHQATVYRTNHMELLSSTEVYQLLLAWL
ncbi:MAG: esterase/lipase family protein [Sphingomonadaceae bacterium]